MGGNALKNCITRRYNKEEYFDINKKLHSSLKYLFPDCQIHTIKSYNNKESFGDLDILIDSESLPSNWVHQVVTMFKSKEHIKNGNVLSFEYKEFQIDLIVTDPSEMETSINYFGYNDLGNLLGRVSHSMGLKLGHDGLSYNWRIDTYQYRNVIILTDFKDILPILGYSYEWYEKGFDDLEDIFKFVVSSRFFTKDIFLLQNRNHTSRVRDAKRKTYMEFLDWIEVEGNVPESDDPFIKYEDKKEWLPYLFANINGFSDIYEQVQTEWEQEVRFKSLYNGDLVREYTGITGKELGNFMKWMKNYYGADYIRKDILAINPALIQNWICYFKNKFDEEIDKNESN